MTKQYADRKSLPPHYPACLSILGEVPGHGQRGGANGDDRHTLLEFGPAMTPRRTTLMGIGLFWLTCSVQGAQPIPEELSPLARLLVGLVEGQEIGVDGASGLQRGPEAASRALREACEEVARKTPRSIDELSEFMGCSNDGMRLTFIVRLSGFGADRAGTQDAMSMVRKDIGREICRNPDVPAMIRLGVTLVYRYVGAHGKLVGDVVIGPNTCTV